MPLAPRRAFQTLKTPLRAVACSLLFAVAPLAHHAAANLVVNGNFTDVQIKTGYTGPALTTLYGQFGTFAQGAQSNSLTVGNWSSAGYNFVFAPGTADAGTQGGANAGQPKQAPGAFNGAGTYGNTYMWGTNNGGTTAITAVPGGGNFIAADGDTTYRGAITQSISGLQIGKTYALSFYWAAAQQQGFDGATTENWQVSLGTTSLVNPAQTTTTYNLPNHGFSGWMQQTFNYTAIATTETLSFLAQGTPNGQPPFLLLGGVTLDLVPEFSNWMVFAGFGAACAGLEFFRRRRPSASLPVLG